MNLKLPKVSIVTSDSSGHGIQGEFSTLSLGLGLHRAWTYLTLFCSTSVFASPVALNAGSSSLQVNFFYLICVVTTIAALYITAAFSSKARSLLLADKTIAIASIMCAIGTLVLLGCSFAGSAAVALAVLSGLCCGISNATLIVFWGMSYARYETMTIVINTTVSIFIALLIFALLSYYIPAPFGAILTALLPLAEIPFLYRNVHPRTEKIAELPRPHILPTNKRVLGIHLAIPVLLFGYALGIVRFFAEKAVNLQDDPTIFFLALLVAGILMILVLVVLFYFTESQADESLMRYMIPILVVAVIFLPLPSIAGSAIAPPLLMAAYLCFKAIIWIFLCGICQRFRLSPLFIIGLGFGSMALGSFLATLSLATNDVIVTITPFGENALIVLAIIAMVIAYALLPRTADIAKAVPRNSMGHRSSRHDKHEHSSTSKSTSASARSTSDYPDKRNNGNEAVQEMPAPAKRMPQVTLPNDEKGVFSKTSSQSANQTNVATSSSSVQSADLSRKNTETHSENSDAFREQCDTISNKYLLSRRENEVLYLLARGHNAAYIQEKLCVAQSTTKTHIYHIYQKLGIHTQQELITMVTEGMEI